MTTVNWTDLFEEAGNVDDSPPPASTYLCEIETADWAQTQTGKAMLKFRARIKSGPQKSKAIFGNITISPENPMALQIGLRHLAALGLTKAVLTSMTESEQIEQVTGRAVQIETQLRKYKGEMRCDVKDIKPDVGANEVAPSAPPVASANTPPPADVPPPVAHEPSTPPPAAPFGDS